jgi:hypothetical protein
VPNRVSRRRRGVSFGWLELIQLDRTTWRCPGLVLGRFVIMIIGAGFGRRWIAAADPEAWRHRGALLWRRVDGTLRLVNPLAGPARGRRRAAR